jgi:ABC-type branched-subunit amino acid transport system substrate-binding protein
MSKRSDLIQGVSRRSLLKAGAGLAGSAMLPNALMTRALAADEPPIGTWPEGSKGSSVTVSIAVPRTGTYAVQGEDELKGWQLAVEHMNSGHELMKKFSPKTTKGVLGKEVKMVVADSGAKPNTAVQAHQRAISEN